MGDYASSIAYYEACIERNPLADVLAEIYREADDPESEIATYRRAFHAGIVEKRIHIQLGNAFFKQLKLNEALRGFETAQTLDPENAYVHYMIGLVYIAYENCQSSFFYLEKAQVLDPDNRHYQQQL
jgi:tetratricopeptide (TPR) repeat protein